MAVATVSLCVTRRRACGTLISPPFVSPCAAALYRRGVWEGDGGVGASTATAAAQRARSGGWSCMGRAAQRRNRTGNRSWAANGAGLPLQPPFLPARARTCSCPLSHRPDLPLLPPGRPERRRWRRGVGAVLCGRCGRLAVAVGGRYPRGGRRVRARPGRRGGGASGKGAHRRRRGCALHEHCVLEVLPPPPLPSHGPRVKF